MFLDMKQLATVTTAVAVPATFCGLKLKPTLIVEGGDVTDECVKIRPRRDAPGVALKCRSLDRLKAAITASTLGEPDAIVRGRRHFIATFSPVGEGITIDV